jgi:hypothetical protein
VWGASAEQAGAWEAELDLVRARGDGRPATLTRAPEAAPGAGLRLRLTRLPE